MAQELLSGTLETAIRAELAALDAASTSLAAFHDGSGVPQKRALQQELMGGGGLLMAGATGRKRAWQAGLTAVRRSSGGAGVASVNLRQVTGLVMGGAGVPLSLAHVLPKGDFMDLAAAASPTVRRLLAPVRGADTRAAVGQREAEQRGAGGGGAGGAAVVPGAEGVGRAASASAARRDRGDGGVESLVRRGVCARTGRVGDAGPPPAPAAFPPLP